MPFPWLAAIAGVGVGTSIVGQSKSSKASRRQQELAEEQWEFQQKGYKAQVESDIEMLETNVEMVGINIESKEKEFEYTMGTFWEESYDIRREQRAALGASGAVISTGSPLALRQKTARRQEEMAQAITGTYEAGKERLELEKGYYEEELGRKKTLLSELLPEEVKPPKKKKKSWTQTGRYIDPNAPVGARYK
jgi:hypothetical protein